MSSQSRHVYTRNERLILEASFIRQSHPDINEKERLAKILNCNLIQISNWFQNHRRQVKKQQKSVASSTSTTTNTISVNSPIFQTTCIYHQPTCPFSINNNNSSYYYYSPSSHYVYSHEPFYTQTICPDSLITDEQ